MQRSADRSNKLKYNRMTDEQDLNQAQTPPDDEQSDNSAQKEDSGDSQAEPGSNKSNEDDQDQE